MWLTYGLVCGYVQLCVGQLPIAESWPVAKLVERIAPPAVKEGNLPRELKSDGVKFMKMECKASNKAIGKELRVRVAPTFILFKGGERAAFMTGAHADELLELIKANL